LGARISQKKKEYMRGFAVRGICKGEEGQGGEEKEV